MSQKLVITVDVKTAEGWREYKFVYRDKQKIERVKKLIEEELGEFSRYLVIDTTFSGVVTGDEEFQVPPYVFDKLFELADEIVFPPDFDP